MGSRLGIAYKYIIKIPERVTMNNNILDQYTNIKANGASQFPQQDRAIGTFDAEIIGVEQPDEKAQRYIGQQHYQWVIKCKGVGKDNHGNQEFRHWITFSAESPEKAQASTAYFASLARQLQEAAGLEPEDKELNAKQALDTIDALKGKTIKLNQTHDGKKFIVSYAKA